MYTVHRLVALMFGLAMVSLGCVIAGRIIDRAYEAHGGSFVALACVGAGIIAGSVYVGVLIARDRADDDDE